jgi:hypothetical protein
MKKTNKHKIVKDLAIDLASEVQSNLPVSVLPDGSVVYKNYLIKLSKSGKWGIYNIENKHLVEQFFLKTCAIMAAKAYDRIDIRKFLEIKQLDNKYWSNYSDTLVYKNNIIKTKSTERYLILLNKLEHSDLLAKHCKAEISRMFKWSFV